MQIPTSLGTFGHLWSKNVKSLLNNHDGWPGIAKHQLVLCIMGSQVVEQAGIFPPIFCRVLVFPDTGRWQQGGPDISAETARLESGCDWLSKWGDDLPLV